MSNPVVEHFKKLHLATFLVKGTGALVTIILCIFLFVWPIVALRINCFFTLACTAFNALGFIQLFVFIPLWLASWVSPKIGSLTLLGWSIFCTFSTFFSVFGGWRTFGATVANVICLGFGVAMASVDIAETKRATGDYDNDFGSYEEDLG
eukprot:CAMPEP_0117440772 /NCGR_PEP_ID=MMETSP0759-20121206/3269_1 /TAXON_ID=63605 /ORGANISM="Percolomonas cosmopolitus, Strain WS" /LENGTH=149 /DNA_ID=CAMNT_0005232561 /DNA_START=1806 /DNA_END=2255 /DNA_ORIENTATION=+